MALAFSCSRFSLSLDRLSSSASSIPTPRERRVSNGDLYGHGTVRFPSMSSFPSVRKPNRDLITMAVPARQMEFRDPPPDLESHLLRNRIVYLGFPLTPEVHELLCSQLIYLNHEDSEKPIYLYINSTGVVKNDVKLGYETEALALYELMSVIDVPIYTLCLGNAWGDAALLLAAGVRRHRAALPSSSIMIKEPLCRFRGHTVDSEVAKSRMKNLKNRMVQLLANHTHQSMEKIEEDIKQPKYFTPNEAVEYGLIDKVLNNAEARVGNGLISQLSHLHSL